MSREEMEKSIKFLEKNQEVMERSMKPISNMLFQRFQSLKEAGFTDEQAIEIIKVRGLQ